MKRVAIVGGGISGLSAAYFLGRRGIPCQIFERRDRLGGIILTETLQGSVLEAGPDSWLADKAWMRTFVEDLGLGDQIIGSNDALRRTYVVRRGRTVTLPASLRMLAPANPLEAVTTRLFSPATKVRMAMEWFRRPGGRGDRSVADFVRDHFGQEAVEYLAQPILAGIYGSAPEDLSAERVLPRFVEYERRHGSILRAVYRSGGRASRGPLFLSLRNGMGSLVEALARRISGTCEIVRGEAAALERTARGWRLALDGKSAIVDDVVLATPSYEAGRLLEGTEPRLAELLGAIGYTSSVVAGLSYAKEGFGHPLDGFGLLVPRAEGGSLAACTWVNTKFAGRVPPGRVLLRAFLAGEAAERATGSGDETVLAETDRELRRWMGFRGRPTATKLYRWDRAMPRYSVGHGEKIREIEARAGSLPGIHLAGNGYDGLGMPDCVRRSESIAARIAAPRGSGIA